MRAAAASNQSGVTKEAVEAHRTRKTPLPSQPRPEWSAAAAAESARPKWLLAVSSGQLGRHGCPQVHIGTAHGDCLGVRREFGFGGARRASQTLCREQCD